MSEMFMNPNGIPNQSSNVSFLKSGQTISQSLGNFFSPIKNFFEENSNVLNSDNTEAELDIDAEIAKLSASAISIQEAMAGNKSTFDIIL